MRRTAWLSWRHLLLAPLLFAFQRCSVLSSYVGPDVGTNPSNPTLYFAGFLGGALACGAAALALPAARRALLRAPVSGWLLVVVLGAACTVARLSGLGPMALLALGGAAFGAAGAGLFARWCEACASLPQPALAGTACLSCALAYALDMARGAFVHGAALSVAATAGAMFLSALPLENLRREAREEAQGQAEGRDGPSLGGAPDEEACSPKARKLLAQGWPVLAAAAAAYLIGGFSWGNALFGLFPYFDSIGSDMLGAGKCLGALAVLALAWRRPPEPSADWVLGASTGLLLASWLITSTLGESPLANALTGLAFGAIDSSALIWACGAWQEGEDAVLAAPLSCALVLAAVPGAVAAGICLTPLVRGVAASLVAPMCDVAFLVSLMATAPSRSRGGAREREEAEALGSLEKLAREAGLSPRETDVFLLLAKGHSSSYIAEALGVSDHTVKTHVKHIYAKLGVHSKDEFLSAVAERA